MLPNWGQTASLLSGPWCPHWQNSPSTPWWCQVQHRRSQWERRLEVHGISLLTNCLPGKPARWLCSEVYLQVSVAPDLQLPTGLLQFAQVWQQCSTLPHQPKGAALLFEHLFIATALAGLAKSKSPRLFHALTLRPDKGWRNRHDLTLSLCFRMQNGSSRLIDFWLFFF